AEQVPLKPRPQKPQTQDLSQGATPGDQPAEGPEIEGDRQNQDRRGQEWNADASEPADQERPGASGLVTADREEPAEQEERGRDSQGPPANPVKDRLGIGILQDPDE